MQSPQKRCEQLVNLGPHPATWIWQILHTNSSASDNSWSSCTLISSGSTGSFDSGGKIESATAGARILASPTLTPFLFDKPTAPPEVPALAFSSFRFSFFSSFFRCFSLSFAFLASSLPRLLAGVEHSFTKISFGFEALSSYSVRSKQSYALSSWKNSASSKLLSTYESIASLRLVMSFKSAASLSRALNTCSNLRMCHLCRSMQDRNRPCWSFSSLVRDLLFERSSRSASNWSVWSLSAWIV
mmetsp:Transcript_94248/g.184795  ORF Transcript_94248/g.184795 Transcript_94248/m.184795 type:complete len:243 (-) Transcript_94248:501-1229(-)